MKYDFVEIGTSNFDTLIEVATDNTRGLSIEPMLYYLDQLPSRPLVQKLNCAVSRNNLFETLSVYYVPENTIQAYGLPDWLRGCNTIGDYHFQHVALNVQRWVEQQQVPCVPIGHVFDRYDITQLDYLKIDTEGSDCAILLHLYDWLADQPGSRYPQKILFESNELAVPAQVELVKQKFINLGYRVTQEALDTILEI